ncbi:hypothetical protein GTX53_24260 [Streptomyces sp. SID5594]|uniref:hypothetical protein n=1 Tax=unclassified Streptomyces TaxID=2593676 RepID=UPI000366724E|nr:MULTISPECIES: hypothetical protein [unclassified Streptomyces]MZF56906.1 hypothetical protein [Streptomyces sp. SID5594]
MNMTETLDLLEQIALIDDRVVKTSETEQEAQLTMWAAILRDVPLQFAGEAVGQHYAESAWPVMPKDIAARWRKTYRDRLGRGVHTFEPNAHRHIDPDDISGFQRALRAQTQAVRTGCDEPIEMRALMAGSDPVAAGTPNEAYRRARAAVQAARAERTSEEVAS